MVGKHTAIVREKINLAGNNWLIKFEFEQDMEFKAGQYLSLKVSDAGDRRSYSIASRPQGKVLELMVDVAPMGIGSKYVLGLNVGDKIEVLCPMGTFSAQPSEVSGQKKMLFVATGSGIVPMKPIIEDLLIDQKYKEKLVLVWGMRHKEELYWIEEFSQLEKNYSNFEFKLVLSQAGDDWGGHRGHVADVFDKNYEGWSAYICGNKEMIAQTAATLESTRIKRENIHYEKFY
jgi:NAD(P)H-flavin reductase